MSHLLNLGLFILIASGLFFAVLKFLFAVSAKQKNQDEKEIIQELIYNFSLSPNVYRHNQSVPLVDAFLEAIIPPAEKLFVSERPLFRPERFVVEGKDNHGRPFIAAIIRMIRHQSGGPRNYVFIYGLHDFSLKERFLTTADERVKIVEDWVVVFKFESISGLYAFSSNRFNELISVLTTAGK